MSLADDLTKLEELRRTGALSDAEFAQAKAKLLAGASPPADSAVVEKLGAQLAETRYQNELARIDREWQIECEGYMITGKYGRRYIPTVGMGLVVAVISGFCGVFMVFMSLKIKNRFLHEDGMSTVAPLIGVAIAIGAVAYGIYVINKAQAYNRAFAAYQKRRAAVKVEDFR